MISSTIASNRPLFLTLVAGASLYLGVVTAAGALAQGIQTTSTTHPGIAGSAQAAKGDIPALFISDVHFDPFHDPGKVKELAAAPAAEWARILSAPASADQPQAFASLQQSCHAKGIDTPFALLRSSLQAMQTRQHDAKFTMVSGDLIAHAFTCRYTTLFPGSPAEDYQAFVVKTIGFVVQELRAAFPGMPVYVALGNNDSGCGDYQLDAGSSFLEETGKVIAEGLPQSQRELALRQFGAGGYYSVTMAEPLRDTRLIVVNDLFLSPKYSTCAGKHDSAAATEQMSWLEQQLAQARQAGQKVWVMGHIPPGVDPYSTALKFRDVCGGQPPVTFLSSDKMANLMVDYGDVVRLGIFAHTHMDEMRLLEPEGGESQSTDGHRVAVKMVASISPVDGNDPSFTAARVDPSSALLENYAVISASNQRGIGTTWTTEYEFAKTYHEAQFSAATVTKLIDEFRIDRGADAATSKAYIHNYFVGDRSRELSPFWPQYVCALDNHTAKAYATCVCSAAK